MDETTSEINCRCLLFVQRTCPKSLKEVFLSSKMNFWWDNPESHNLGSQLTVDQCQIFGQLTYSGFFFFPSPSNPDTFPIIQLIRAVGFVLFCFYSRHKSYEELVCRSCVVFGFCCWFVFAFFFPGLWISLGLEERKGDNTATKKMSLRD